MSVPPHKTDDRPPRAPGAARNGRRAGRGAIIALIAVNVVVELALQGADLGLWGPARLRQMAYEYGGFWPGLLHGWQPNYRGQGAAMFLSYAFLHGGALHLAVNMVTLWSLGMAVVDRAGARGLWWLYAGSALGGAAGYGLLATTVQPMVGASGALFGLAGALLAWMAMARGGGGEGRRQALRVGLFLLVMNLVMYWALDGQLAWQTHLGGFAAGWALAHLLDRRERAAPRSTLR